MNVTGSAVEVKIQYHDLLQAVTDLKTLQEQITSRNLEVNFTKAEGDVPEQLIQLAIQLKSVGGQFSLVVGQTAAWMDSVRMEFLEAEKRAILNYKK